MTVAASTSSQPPNSAKPEPRVSNFNDSSDDDEVESTPKTEKKKKKKVKDLDVNGVNSPKSPKKRKIGGANGDLGKAKKDGAEARRREAERLLEKRKELPFYQGETGCGKSTQLPQLLRTHPISVNHFSPSLSDRFRKPSIAITQPRRLPAIALANRVSQEMGCQIGGEVGYSVRFEDVTSRETRVRYLTEGVLMRELAGSDPKFPPSKEGPDDLMNGERENGSDSSEGQGLNLLLNYDIVIIDEAHERTLNTDFLCGALKRVQRIRKNIVRLQAEGESQGKEKITGKKKVKELKLVIMSATLDPTKFKTFFGTGRDALLVKGRMYEVATQHVLEPVDDFIEAAARQVMTIHCSPNSPGDILVFMPGSEEIENCVELLKRVSKQLAPGSSALQVLPLYAALPPTAQSKIFVPTPPNTRRIIVATNIAETSMTIPGVAFVIDSGFKKEKEYVFRNAGALEHLRKKGISKASAWQRTGRAGRERAGHCYRLFTQDFFNRMPEFDAPEIQRCNLSSAVLQLIAMGQNPFDFEYIDNPGRDSILAAFQELVGLSALSSPTTITPLGLQMLRFPLDPPHARILLAAFEYGCPNEIIDIISLSLVGWCKDNHVNSKTLAQALKVRDQLRELSERLGKDWKSSCGSEWGMVGKSLLQGLFMNTAVIQADGSYRQTAGSLTVKIHPSSVLMSKKVPAILYDELTITTAFYARNVSAFEQHWLTEVPCYAKTGTSVAAPVGKGSL
ncbi:ATP-dependent RNA helicase prh1 [Cryptococcus deuterogattii 99/473]|uniref:RNA helicase n=1 Tax=Cryptococcus deuterogattii Ram5 TaxID=1296110 RepID=A0A0D0T8Z2_9TREE|nr:ATP-dependent RNA helicase prh1 [Cryptococcus deuterogattii Ram5]KIY56052.1 ATP-dependent RNA helicase prh1 [Cryptococcus deuterogattii 99/473]